MKRALDPARELAGALARDLAGALDRELLRALDRALDRARDLASALASALDLDLDLASARHLARDLAGSLASAGNLASELANELAAAGVGRGQRGAVRVVPLAGQLLAAAARLLPAGDRARYAEEFRSELTEIARAGAGRRRQLAHATRVVVSARRLRADLRAPRRRGAAP